MVGQVLVANRSRPFCVRWALECVCIGREVSVGWDLPLNRQRPHTSLANEQAAETKKAGCWKSIEYLMI